jgi:LPXTG-motif cell wall-anchored protein
MSAVRTSTRLAFALLAGLLVLAFSAPAAHAQQDPYGSTTTSIAKPRIVEATLDLQPDKAKVGDTVVATVGSVFFGEKVDIVFDGVVVGRGQAPLAAASAGAPVAFNGAALPAQADDISTTIKITFSVPNASVGQHKVAAVGDTFVVEKGFEVLSGTGTSKLPKTGIYIALLLVIGLALIVGGRAFIAASRVRRRTNAAFMLDDEADDYTFTGSSRH